MGVGCWAVLEEGGQPDDSALPPEGARFPQETTKCALFKKEGQRKSGAAIKSRGCCQAMKACVALPKNNRNDWIYMTSEKDKKGDWVDAHLAYLRGLTSHNDTQKFFILLAEKQDKTLKEKRTFALLVKSEKALQIAQIAQAKVSSVLDEKAGKERRERTHKLIQLGLLFGYSELDESPRDFLAGLLLLGANMPEQERQKLSELGADLLAKKEPKKGKKTPASPPAAPAQTPQSAPAPTQRPAPAPAPAAAPAKAPAPAAAAAPAPAKAPAAADVVLDVNFSDKDAVKALGARFNYDSKKWFVPAGMDTQPFKKWMV